MTSATPRHIHIQESIGWLAPAPDGRYRIEHRADNTIVLTPDPDTGPPYRFVDNTQRGWLTLGEGRCSTYPSLSAATRETFLFSEVVARRGPIRPVEPPSRRDVHVLEIALAAAGPQAVQTTMVVLHRFYQECRNKDGHSLRLTAGRPGSWESAVLETLAAGSDCFTAQETHLNTLHTVTEVLTRWLFNDNVYVELAEGLASIFGSVIDVVGGWNNVTTPKLRRSRIGGEAHHLLASQAERGQHL